MASRLALPVLLAVVVLASVLAGLLLLQVDGTTTVAEQLPDGPEGSDGQADGESESEDDSIALASLSIPPMVPEGSQFVVGLGLYTTAQSALERAATLGPRGPEQGVQEVVDAGGRVWFLSMLGPVDTMREANLVALEVRRRHGAYPTIHIAPVPPE